MILYLKPPPVLIDLRKFNECCYSRLQFFISTVEDETYDYLPESMTPGTKIDGVGHFVLRCLCLHDPTITDFIVKNERKLFQCRLAQYSKNEHLLRKACKTVMKDVHFLRTYRELNPLTGTKEHPPNWSLLLTTLSCVCELFLRRDIDRHFRLECSENCNKFEIEVPFQMCLTLVKTRSVKLNNGFVIAPCSLWTQLLVELFDQHYSLGLSMISRSIRLDTDLDIRWTEMFERLTSMYHVYLNEVKRARPYQSLTARMVDAEKDYFPPCMSHLLNMLRSNHRLSYTWRYLFSLFLKDIGLSVEESIQFWKTEYSKSCSAASACQHSWKENQRKYTYSIRHMYGLEGSRKIGRSKTCNKLQTLVLGIRDEGGCPFVHFDDAHLLRSLSDAVIDSPEVVQKILTLKVEGKANEACNTHFCNAISTFKKYGQSQSQIAIQYESPLEYYFNFKNYTRMSQSW